MAVAEAGSITGAAGNLHIAQSAISTAIANLEDHLSVQLFIRNRAKGVKLTQAGARFLAQARELLAHAAEVSEFGRDYGAVPSGELTVGCFSFIAPFFLPGVLSGFCRQYPQVSVVVHEDNIQGVQTALLQATCDVGLVYDVNLSSRLHKETIASYPPYVLLSADHRLAHRRKVSLTELEGEPFVQIDLPSSRDYSMVLASEAGVTLNVAFRTQSYEMVRGLVAHGFGYAILNQRWKNKKTYDGKSVVTVELDGRLPGIDLVVAYVAGMRQLRRVEVFTQFCRKRFAAG